MIPISADPVHDFDIAFSMDFAPITAARINKFPGRNFHFWKFKMMLEEQDLWDHVRGGVKLEYCHSTLDQATFKWKS